MKIPCTIIDDLMPLCIDGACSMDTKEIVEEHLSECEACRLKYQDMTAILLPEEAEPPAPKKEIVFHSKKAFKKIRRRWIAALLCILLLFPITFLSVNQYRKEGICFTNLDDIYRVNAFLNAVKKENYEKAFSYLDIEGSYNDLIEEPDVFSPAGEFKEVEINGDTYYVDEEILLNEYERYALDRSVEKRESEADFWLSAFQASDREPILIPKEVYLEHQDTFIELNESYRTSFTANTYKASVLLELASGAYYYFCDETGEDLSQMKESEAAMTFLDVTAMSILPADVYSYALKKAAAEKEKIDIFRNRCLDMGYETYYDNCKKNFLENMNQLKSRGIKIDYSFSTAYQNENGYQLNYDLILTVNDKNIRGIGIILFSAHNSITCRGFYYDPLSTEPLFHELNELISNVFYIRGIDF